MNEASKTRMLILAIAAMTWITTATTFLYMTKVFTKSQAVNLFTTLTVVIYGAYILFAEVLPRLLGGSDG